MWCKHLAREHALKIALLAAASLTCTSCIGKKSGDQKPATSRYLLGENLESSCLVDCPDCEQEPQIQIYADSKPVSNGQRILISASGKPNLEWQLSGKVGPEMPTLQWFRDGAACDVSVRAKPENFAGRSRFPCAPEPGKYLVHIAVGTNAGEEVAFELTTSGVQPVVNPAKPVGPLIRTPIQTGQPSTPAAVGDIELTLLSHGRQIPDRHVFDAGDATFGRLNAGDLEFRLRRTRGDRTARVRVNWYYTPPGGTAENSDYQEVVVGNVSVTQRYSNEQAPPGNYRVVAMVDGRAGPVREFTIRAR